MPLNKTDIDWCTNTWNPVTGCLHGCPYCYARVQARRFAGHYYESVGVRHRGYREDGPGQLICDEDVQYLYDQKRSNDGGIFVVQSQPRFTLDAPLPFQTKAGKMVSAPYPFGFCPTFHAYRLSDPAQHKKPARVFVGSMTDLFGSWVPDDWIERVFAACAAAPWHLYIFLTKNPDRYASLSRNGLLPTRKNFWFGTTITGAEPEWLRYTGPQSFVSIEPLLGEFKAVDMYKYLGWVIIGALTGPGASKCRPERAWIEEICAAADSAGVPVFMKDSLLPVMGEEGMRREWPAGMVT